MTLNSSTPTRQLATIRTISDIKPIDGADYVELAIVDGWQCVVSKGVHNIGDEVIYFEIDSFLPIDPRFEFLRKSSFRTLVDREGFRLKTMKFKGQISQGLVLPIEQFPEVLESDRRNISETLNVIKWDPPVPTELAGERINFPTDIIRKTHQERLQNIYQKMKTEYFDRGVTFEASLKMDGTSMTCYYNDGHYGVCGHNYEFIEDPNNNFWQVSNKLDLHNKIKSVGNFAIAGELMGHGIQGNREKLTERTMYIFDVYDIDSSKYLLPSERMDFLKELGLLDYHTKIIDPEFRFDCTLEDVIELASATKSISHNIGEGIVFKANQRNSFGEVEHFKVISNRFLMKCEK